MDYITHCELVRLGVDESITTKVMNLLYRSTVSAEMYRENDDKGIRYIKRYKKDDFIRILKSKRHLEYVDEVLLILDNS